LKSRGLPISRLFICLGVSCNQKNGKSVILFFFLNKSQVIAGQDGVKTFKD
jgi:hypothetical protein